jgi:flagellar basal-body rod modification protein FlgD
MAISPISSTTTAASSATAAQGVMDKNGFMKLLVAQLKHQDPTSPTDMNGMTEQMTQFGILEQLTNVAGNTEATLQSLAGSQALDLLGRNVKWTDAAGAVTEGVVENVDASGKSPTLTIGGKVGIGLGQVVGAR